MAQAVIRNFMAELVELVEMPDPIVEFGSLQAERETQDGDLRPLFPGRDFTGTDMRAGPGVDRVEDLRALSYEDGEIGTAICLDTLEHCEDPPAACRELCRVVRAGGICVISSVLLFEIHAYPNDYFRFTPEGLRSMLGGFHDVWATGIGDPALPVQVVAVAGKRELNLSLQCFPSLAEEQRASDQSVAGVRYGAFVVPPRIAARELVRQTPRLIRQRIRRG